MPAVVVHRAAFGRVAALQNGVFDDHFALAVDQTALSGGRSVPGQGEADQRQPTAWSDIEQPLRAVGHDLGIAGAEPDQGDIAGDRNRTLIEPEQAVGQRHGAVTAEGVRFIHGRAQRAAPIGVRARAVPRVHVRRIGLHRLDGEVSRGNQHPLQRGLDDTVAIGAIGEDFGAGGNPCAQSRVRIDQGIDRDQPVDRRRAIAISARNRRQIGNGADLPPAVGRAGRPADAEHGQPWIELQFQGHPGRGLAAAEDAFEIRQAELVGDGLSDGDGARCIALEQRDIGHPDGDDRKELARSRPCRIGHTDRNIQRAVEGVGVPGVHHALAAGVEVQQRAGDRAVVEDFAFVLDLSVGPVDLQRMGVARIGIEDADIQLPGVAAPGNPLGRIGRRENRRIIDRQNLDRHGLGCRNQVSVGDGELEDIGTVVVLIGQVGRGQTVDRHLAVLRRRDQDGAQALQRLPRVDIADIGIAAVEQDVRFLVFHDLGGDAFVGDRRALVLGDVDGSRGDVAADQLAVDAQAVAGEPVERVETDEVVVRPIRNGASVRARHRHRIGGEDVQDVGVDIEHVEAGGIDGDGLGDAELADDEAVDRLAVRLRLAGEEAFRREALDAVVAFIGNVQNVVGVDADALRIFELGGRIAAPGPCRRSRRCTKSRGCADALRRRLPRRPGRYRCRSAPASR